MRPNDDNVLEWMDETPITADAWAIFEEAARLASLAKDQPNNLHLAGKVYGLAIALQVMDRDSTHAAYGSGYSDRDVCEWIEFIEAYAGDNYERGVRID